MLFLPGPGPLLHPQQGIPAVQQSLDLTADTGAATADGGTASLTFTWTAATGAATASGGTVTLSATLTAASGAATASGTTPVLTVTLTATAGTATASGGDATTTVATPDVIFSGGTRGIVRAPRPATPAHRPPVRVSVAIGGLSPPGGPLDLTADTGTATASGGTASLAFTWTATTGTATAGGGDATASTAQFPIPDVVAAGGTHGTIRAARPATAPRPLTRVSVTIGGLTPPAGTNLTADTGTATASGGDATVSITGQASVDIISVGRTRGIVRAVRVTQKPAARTSWTVPLAPAPGTLDLTATAGTATAAGTASTLAFTWTASTGAATAAGGTATATTGGTSAQGGTATAAGGTATVRFTWTATTGAASATGGTVNRINLAATGTAIGAGGTVALTWTLNATTGNATAGGGSAVSFVPTLGTIDGSSGLITGADSTTGLAGLVDAGSALVGIG